MNPKSSNRSQGSLRSSIRDVAARARVSTASVSHVINNTRFVSEEVRTRVLEAVKELHYYPSATARSLSTKRTKTIGVIISDIQNPFYGPLIRGMDSVLNRVGYDILLTSNDEDPEKEGIHLRTLLSRSVDGIIMTPSSSDISFLKVVESLGTRVLFIDRVPPNSHFSSVTVKNQESSRLIVQHLVDDGHKKIGIILGLDRSTINDRLSGYKQALQENGIKYDQGYVMIGGSQQQGGYRATKELLNKNTDVTATFSLNPMSMNSHLIHLMA